MPRKNYREPDYEEAARDDRSWMKFSLEEFKPGKASWEHYKRRLLNGFQIYNVPEDKQVLVLLHVIGQETYSKLSDLCSPKYPEDKSLEDLFNILSNYLEPEPNRFAERVKFHDRRQQTNESIQTFALELKNLSKHCKFPTTWLDEALCTQFIIGVTDNRLRLELFTKTDLNFHTAVDIGCMFERNVNAASSIQLNHTSSEDVLNIKSSKLNLKHNATGKSSDSCFRCSRKGHKPERCRFKEAICFRCQKKGHIATVCKAVVKQVITEDENDENNKEKEKETVAQIDDKDDDFGIWQVRQNLRNKLTVSAVLGNVTEIFQIDTAAAVSIMNHTKFRKLLPEIEMKPTSIRLKSYTNTPIIVKGVCTIEVTINNQKKRVDLYIVKGNQESLMGLEWLRVFKLNWKEIFEGENSVDVNCIGDESRQKRLVQLIEKYSEIFQPGVGKIKGSKARIVLKENSRPIFKRARPVAFAMRPKISMELDRLVKEGIITKVDRSDYATPVVPVIKRDGSIRLCGDYKVTINKQLLADEHPIPSIQNLLNELGNKKVYSKIDITQAYNQVEIHPDDRKFTTIITHQGLYEYNRLPFGISSAPDIWQRTIEDVLKGIRGIAIFYDDIGLGSETEEEHFELLELVFRRFKEHNVQINSGKCDFFKKAISYCGYKISEAGIEKQYGKVEAMLKAREPQNTTEVKSFMGMVNFYGQFIPNLSTLAFPLNNLLKKGKPFHFGSECKEAFNKIKSAIASEQVLVHFDEKKQLILSTDASPYGLGAVLSHVMDDGSERPISFASKTLSKSELNYSQIDKEALAIVFGVKKFYPYLYGRRFTLVTDHKPLISIFHPEKEIPKLSAMRMQHYAIYLQGFNYDIIYRRSQDHGNADALSRLPSTSEELQLPVDADIFLLHQIHMLPITKDEIKKELLNDTVANRIRLALIEGREMLSKECFNRDLTEYTLQDDCLFWRDRVPLSLRKRILNDLHEGHQGIRKTKSIARNYVWWPGLDRDVENIIKNCELCQSIRNNPRKVPIHKWEYPEAPMERVHIDYMGPLKGSYYLVVTDAFSKWLEVYPVSNITTKTTINCLARFFSSFGLPQLLVSDNGAQFKSEDFKNFCRSQGIRQVFTAPFHPATNGSAERNVQTTKNRLKIALLSKEPIQAALLEFLFVYRRTPHSVTGIPPAVLFLGRNLRSRWDLIVDKSNIWKQAEILPKLEALKRHESFPDGVKQFAEGETIMVRFYGDGTSKWRKGTIKKKQGRLHYEVEVDGELHRRHVDQLQRAGGLQNGRRNQLQ